METKGKNVHLHHRKRLKWWLKNNYVFLIIIVIVCAIVALLIGVEAYNFERVKSMEAILDKDLRTIHRKTGITDLDIKKLEKVYPDFNWEETWDRSRWLERNKDMKKQKSRLKAKEDFRAKK